MPYNQQLGPSREYKEALDKKIELLIYQIGELDMTEEEKKAIFEEVKKLSDLINMEKYRSDNVKRTLREQTERVRRLARLNRSAPSKTYTLQQLNRMRSNKKRYDVPHKVDLKKRDVKWSTIKMKWLIYPEAKVSFSFKRTFLRKMAEIDIEGTHNTDGLKRLWVLDILSQIPSIYDDYRASVLGEMNILDRGVKDKRRTVHRDLSKKIKRGKRKSPAKAAQSTEIDTVLDNIESDPDVLEDLVGSAKYKSQRGKPVEISSRNPNDSYSYQITGTINGKTPQGLVLGLYEYEFMKVYERKDGGQDISSIKIFSPEESKNLQKMIKGQGSRLFEQDFGELRKRYLERGYIDSSDIEDMLAYRETPSKKKTHVAYSEMIRKVLYRSAMDSIEIDPKDKLKATILKAKEGEVLVHSIGRIGYRNMGLEQGEDIYYSEISGNKERGVRNSAIFLSNIESGSLENKYKGKLGGYFDDFVEGFKGRLVNTIVNTIRDTGRTYLPYIRIIGQTGKREIKTGYVEEDRRADQSILNSSIKADPQYQYNR